MKIVITDGYTLNPGDLSWQSFEDFGEVVYYDRTSLSEVAERCRNARIIITNKTPINKEVISVASGLKMIAVTATGYNVVDIIAAKQKGVTVCNVPEYGTHSVAQHTFSLVLELSNHVGRHAQSVSNGDWVKSPDFSYVKSPVIELKDKILGIIGLGRIGRQTMEIACAFGMNVIYNGGSDPTGRAKQVSQPELFSQSDFISLHCPLKADNQGFVNKTLLSRMKSTAFLINTSRGQLINEQDLANALKSKTIAGAALDVLSKEPPPPDHPLLNISNCLITPHIAWVSFEARKRIMDKTHENIKAFISGRAQNVVT
jgi:glycerate dehydrogenase